MASQRDFFESGSEDGNKEEYRVSSSLNAIGKKVIYNYQWVILFSWDVDQESPFGFHPLTMFNDSDIKPNWIQKHLGIASRIIQLKKLSPFPGQIFSLFGKIEKGKRYVFRKNSLVIHLNNLINALIEEYVK